MDEDAYIPDSDDLKDWEELVEANRQWNKKTFTLVVHQKPKVLDRVRFIEHLRLAIITKIPDYRTKTRREIIEQLDQWYQVREELRRYCDITEQDFESMLDGLTFPYLERAWASMFHSGILEDMEEDRKMFAEKNDPQPKQEQPVVPQSPPNPQPKVVVKKVTKRSMKDPDAVRPKQPEPVKEQPPVMTARDLLPKREVHPPRLLTDDELLDRIMCECRVDRYVSRVMRNNIRIMMFRERLKVQYHDQPISLETFLDLCNKFKVSPARMDCLFDTGKMMANLAQGSTKGLLHKEDIQIMFEHIFHVRLEL